MNNPSHLPQSRSARPVAVCRRRIPAGFTLVELLVVIAIIGILAGLVSAGAYHAIISAETAPL